MKLDWRTRINAIDALEHPYFKMAPLPMEPHEIPTYEESHELDRRKFQDRKAALPPAPKGGTVGIGPDANGATAGFNSGDGYGGRNGAPNGRFRGADDHRRPAWQRDRGPPPGRGPPPDRGGRDDDYRDRGPPRGRPGGPPGQRGGPDTDTYIPSYGREDGARRRDDRPRDDRRPPNRDDRRPDRDRDHRTSRSRSPGMERRDRDRERDRDRDMYRR